MAEMTESSTYMLAGKPTQQARLGKRALVQRVSKAPATGASAPFAWVEEDINVVERAHQATEAPFAMDDDEQGVKARTEASESAPVPAPTVDDPTPAAGQRPRAMVSAVAHVVRASTAAAAPFASYEDSPEPRRKRNKVAMLRGHVVEAVHVAAAGRPTAHPPAISSSARLTSSTADAAVEEGGIVAAAGMPSELRQAQTRQLQASNAHSLNPPFAVGAASTIPEVAPAAGVSTGELVAAGMPRKDRASTKAASRPVGLVPPYDASYVEPVNAGARRDVQPSQMVPAGVRPEIAGAEEKTVEVTEAPAEAVEPVPTQMEGATALPSRLAPMPSEAQSAARALLLELTNPLERAVAAVCEDEPLSERAITTALCSLGLPRRRVFQLAPPLFAAMEETGDSIGEAILAMAVEAPSTDVIELPSLGASAALALDPTPVAPAAALSETAAADSAKAQAARDPEAEARANAESAKQAEMRRLQEEVAAAITEAAEVISEWMEVAPPSAVRWSMDVAEHGAAAAGARGSAKTGSRAPKTAAPEVDSPQAMVVDTDSENRAPQAMYNARPAASKAQKQALVWVTDGNEEDEAAVADRAAAEAAKAEARAAAKARAKASKALVWVV